MRTPPLPADFFHARACKPFCEKSLTLPSFERVAILVAIAVNEDGYREVLGAAEGMKEDKASWVRSFQWPRGRSLDGVNR